MSDNEIGIEEQLVIAKANQEIRDLLEKYGLRIEKGKLISQKKIWKFSGPTFCSHIL